jgi:pyruvate formate lyase activating enzyme
MPPEEIVSRAKETGCLSIAYTYTEPTVTYEYVLDTARIAREKGIINVMHSNGYINPEPLRQLYKYIAAVNIDLKGFTPRYYQEICSADLKTVLNSLIMVKQMGVWLEITNLVIPTLNDNEEDIKKMCRWIKENLGDNVPIHFSRFHPMYKLVTLPPTPVSTLETARNIGIEAGLKHVYIGNLPGHPGENTYCPNCSLALIKRVGYTIVDNSIIHGRCKGCGYKIEGIWT